MEWYTQDISKLDVEQPDCRECRLSIVHAIEYESHLYANELAHSAARPTAYSGAWPQAGRGCHLPSNHRAECWGLFLLTLYGYYAHCPFPTTFTFFALKCTERLPADIPTKVLNFKFRTVLCT